MSGKALPANGSRTLSSDDGLGSGSKLGVRENQDFRPQAP